MNRRSTRTALHSRASLACLVAAGLVLAFAPSALALSECEVSEKNNGTLQISAKKVRGALRFGTTPDVVEGRFDNADTCLDGRKAWNCTVAAKGEPERTTHPPLCRYYLEDDEDSCVARVKDCSPGLRPTCPPDMERMGDTCIDRVAGSGEFNEAVFQCAARGRSLCTQNEIMECDALNLSKSRSQSCGAKTDGGGWLWTLDSVSEEGQSVFSRVPVYRDDNRVTEYPTDFGSIYGFFCCAALGTP